MLFVELRFLFFFLAVLGVHWALPWNRARKVWLLATSYLFYAAWDWRYLLLILTSTVIDHFAGRGVARATSSRGRRGWLLFSLVGNLGLLGFFKYYNFFVSSTADFLRVLGLPASDWTLSIILPIGISFYTFQTLSYTIDIYFGRLEPAESPLDLALFVGFFPQLVAGPIVRAVQFLPQLTTRRRFETHVPSRAALAIFFTGFVKKALSDTLAPWVDQVFSDPAAHGMGSAWLGAALFHVQVYCDFSGYSDMAIGLAGLLGYQLPRNFHFPYFTGSMTSFWQRWHITLGQWFVHYVYVPLGGNRRGTLRTLRNLMVVFLISGLWHGASWNFVIFGLIHGLFVVLERLGLKEILDRAPALVSRFYANLVFLLSLVFFRSPDLSSSVRLLERLFVPHPGGSPAAELAPLLWLLVAGFLVVHALLYVSRAIERAERIPIWVFASGYGAAAALVLPWVTSGYTPFIYFQF